MRTTRPWLLLLPAALAAGALAAQNPVFPSPNYFKMVFARPVQISLEMPGSLRDLLQDGKLRLSIEDLTRLVVARNTEVWLARMDVAGSQPAIMRASGAFDARFFGQFTTNRAVSPTATQLEGSSTLSQNTTFNYTQLLATGTNYTVGFGAAKSASNNAFVILNPSIRANLNFSVTQPLLRNRGLFIQRAPVVIARINSQVSRDRFEQTLTTTIQTAQNQYWDVIQARENLAVLKNSLALAEKSYDRDKRALELGALPPLDIFRSQAEVANRRVQVSNAEYQLQQQEDVLRRLIAADLDPEVRKAPLELIDSPLYPGKTTALETTPAEELVTQALAKRPEVSILQRRHTLDDIGIRQALNALRPDLRLGGNYSSSGLGGNSLVSGVRLHGGLADALRQVADFNNPTYGLTLTLNLPIKSRQAQADLADAEITRRRNLYEQRNTEQNISLEVRNALNRLLQSKANIEGSAAARDLAKKNLEAEQRKYELGATTIFFVLEAQQRASDAETQYLAASVAYKKAVIALQRATGSLLDDNNVVLEQALAGK